MIFFILNHPIDVAKIQKNIEKENLFVYNFINSIVFCIFAPNYCAYEDAKRTKETGKGGVGVP